MMGVRKGHSDPTFIKAPVNGKVAPIPAVRRTIGTDGDRSISVIPRCYGAHPEINLWWALSITV